MEDIIQAHHHRPQRLIDDNVMVAPAIGPRRQIATSYAPAARHWKVRAARTSGCREDPQQRGRGSGSVPTVPRGLLCAVTPIPILQRMWETAKSDGRWLALAFHVKRLCVFHLAPLALPLVAISFGYPISSGRHCLLRPSGQESLQISWGFRFSFAKAEICCS